MEPATAPAATRVVTSPHPLQRQLLDKLFPAGTGELELDDKNATIVSGARSAHNKALEDALEPRYFQRHRSRVSVGFAIMVVTMLVAFRVSNAAGTAAILLVLFSMLLVLAVFGRLVRAPTQEGRRLLDEIEGLKLYLSVAERDKLSRLQAPDAAPALNAERYEVLLPYAVALDVEDAGTRKFTAVVGVTALAAATQRMGWYSGTGGAADLSDFSRAIGSSLTSSIAAASTPRGSSSGSGGGGSSGGGGGGGGGGGR